MDLISVIIPVYNENDIYLKECLNSVMDQTYKNIEVILVDDGMSNENRNTVSSYLNGPVPVTVIGGKNEGVSAARNKGIEAAQGKWIAFIDSDDWIDAEYLQKLHTAAVDHNSDIVICGYERVYDSGREEIVKPQSFAMDQSAFLTSVLNVQNGFGFVHMKLYRKDLFASGIRFDTSLALGEDALLNIELSSQVKKVYYLAEPLYNFRFNSASAVRGFREDFAKTILRAMVAAKNSLEQMGIEPGKDYYGYVSYHVLLVIVNYCCHPDNPQNGIASIRKVMQIPLFRECVARSGLKEFSLTRKVTLLTLKTRLYILTDAIGIYRQKQFRKG